MPRGIRNAAVICLVLAGTSGLWAVSETWGLFRPPDEEAQTSAFRPHVSDDAAVQQRSERQYDQAVAKGIQAANATIASMREVRAVILAILSVACALCVASASRILRPLGLSREGGRRLLVISLLAAGFARTADGAQTAVVMRHLANAFQKALPASTGAGDAEAMLAQMGQAAPLVLIALTVGWTLVVAGGFVVLAQYFRSERVQRIVEFRDSHPEG